MNAAEVDRLLPHFEGLVHETARQIVKRGVELEFDDVRQLLRIKAWNAVSRFSPERAAASEHLSQPRDRNGRTPLERYVYTCVRNMRKDIEKRPSRYTASLDDLRARTDSFEGGDSEDEWFDGKYLSVDAERVFFEVEDEEPVLPSTLTRLEREVIALRCEGLLLSEIDAALGLGSDQAKTAMRSVREKLADWRPSADERVRAPRPPLPVPEPEADPAQPALAA